MKNANFIAFDFETATMQHAACQLGMAIVKEGEVVKTINRMIQPPKNRYTPQCVAVHGITPEQTANAPTFDVVWDEVKTYFEANFVVAHNLKFDLEVLNKSLQRSNLPPPIFMGKACYMLQQKCSIIFCWSNACFWTKEISHNGNGDLSAGVVSF